MNIGWETDGGSAWPGLDFGTDNLFTLQHQAVDFSQQAGLASFLDSVSSEHPLRPESPLDCGASVLGEVGLPSQPPLNQPTSPQPASAPDLAAGTPTHPIEQVDTPNNKSGSASRGRARWVPEEEALLAELAGDGDPNGVEWDTIATRLGTGRTPSAVKGKWRMIRDPNKGKAKPGKEKGKSSGGTLLKQQLARANQPTTPTLVEEAAPVTLDSIKQEANPNQAQPGREPIASAAPANDVIATFLVDDIPVMENSVSDLPLIASPETLTQPFPPSTAPPQPVAPSPVQAGPSNGEAILNAIANVKVTLKPDVFGVGPTVPYLNGRPWSSDEDCSLLGTVMMYSDRDWTKLAQVMNNGRTAVECQARLKLLAHSPVSRVAPTAVLSLGQTVDSMHPTPELGNGLRLFGHGSTAASQGSVSAAVTNYNQLAVASGAPFGGGYVAPTNSTATLPNRQQAWNYQPTPTSVPISSHTQARSPPAGYLRPAPPPTGAGFIPNHSQSRRSSLVSAGGYTIVPPPSPAQASFGSPRAGPPMPVRRPSYDLQQRQGLANLVGAQAALPSIATPQLPSMGSMMVGGGMGTVLPGAVRRPSLVPHVYSPEGSKLDQGVYGGVGGVGGGGVWQGRSSSFKGIKAEGNGMASGSGGGPIDPFAGGSVGERAGLPEGSPVQFRENSEAPRTRLGGSGEQAPLSPRQRWERQAPVRPPARTKRSSSGPAAASRRVTRSVREGTEGAEGIAVVGGGMYGGGEVGRDEDAEGSLEPAEDAREVEAISAAVAVAMAGRAGQAVSVSSPEVVAGMVAGGLGASEISPRGHLKRKCTSPSYEGEKGKLKSYKEEQEEEGEGEEQE